MKHPVDTHRQSGCKKIYRAIMGKAVTEILWPPFVEYGSIMRCRGPPLRV